MTDPAAETQPGTLPESLAVTAERDLPHPPDKVWRALTQPHLIAEWLMRTDLVSAEPGRRFTLSGDWGAVACRVLEAEPPRILSYTWDAFGLESVVTFTLAPTESGTRLRLEQRGFRPDQGQFRQGAGASWPGFLARLESALDREA